MRNPDFTERARQVIRAIPQGMVLTYGDVARLAGSPRGARQVGWLLNQCGDDLPWWRVVNARGEVSLRNSEGMCRQFDLLRAEGSLQSGASIVNLAEIRWDPSPDELRADECGQEVVAGSTNSRTM